MGTRPGPPGRPARRGVYASPKVADRFLGRKFGGLTTVSLLGKGGMGRVYRAVDAAGAEVAVKILPLEAGAAKGSMAARFKREIKACIDLHHKHVVRIFDAGTEEDFDWFSMEVLDGETLQGKLRGRGKLEVPEALRIARELALALGYIHARGIIHRDLKPGNVMLVRSGRTVLMDFGLAKVVDGTRITQTGHGLGTPRYMAPEMLLAKEPVPATDLYQLGVVLYEMLTGQTVVKAKSFATLAHELTQVYPAPLLELDPSIPRDLDRLVFNCLEKEPEDRYRSAEAFLDALDRYEKGEPITATGTFKTITLTESRMAGPGGEPEPTTVEARYRPMRVSGSSPSMGSGDGSGPAGPRGETPFSFSLPKVVEPAFEAARPHTVAIAAGLAAAALLWIFLAPPAVGDYGLRGAPRATVSPKGAELVYQTVEAMPGRVRLYREAQGTTAGALDDRSRDYPALDAEPGVVHRFTLDRLVAGRGYVAKFLFPDGREDHPLAFRIPEAPRIDGLRLRRGDGGATLSFGFEFPVGGRVRWKAGSLPSEAALAGDRQTEWKVPVPVPDPFQAVAEVFLELDGAAGWEEKFGPYGFPGLDAELIEELARVDPARELALAREARGRPGGARDAVLQLQERLQAAGTIDALLRFAPVAGAFFAGPGRSFEARAAVLGALGRLAPIDFFCTAMGMPRLLEVERLYGELAGVGGVMRYDRLPPPDLARIELEPAPPGTPLGFDLPAARPGFVECEVVLERMDPEDYYELDFNGLVRIPVPSGELRAKPGPVRRVVRLPVEAARAGPNVLTLARGELAPPVPAGAPPERPRIAVYHRPPGGP